MVTDVSKPEQVEALADETLRHFGAVHVVCNNAGVGTETMPSWSGTLDDWAWVLGVNLMGVIYGVRTFLPILIDQGDGGHIVNTASLAGLVSGGNTPYAVSKFGVVALSEGVYLELKQGGYRPSISVLCPGFVEHATFSTARRNRPPELADTAAPMTGPIVDVFREWFAEQVKQGMSPRRVGDQVLAAIRDDRFYILTHPDWNALDRAPHADHPGRREPDRGPTAGLRVADAEAVRALRKPTHDLAGSTQHTSLKCRSADERGRIHPPIGHRRPPSRVSAWRLRTRGDDARWPRTTRARRWIRPPHAPRAFPGASRIEA